jgi:hypothetical protein|tara:strand:+ start:220 stop:396 length:177 start_codon:yes stop_codon:yes gene_type:complete
MSRLPGADAIRRARREGATVTRMRDIVANARRARESTFSSIRTDDVGCPLGCEYDYEK